VAVQQQLSVLVGEPKPKSEPQPQTAVAPVT
jgi:hypothetical protein